MKEMSDKKREAIHRMLDACIDRTLDGFDIWFEFTPHVKWVVWRTEAHKANRLWWDNNEDDFLRLVDEEIEKVKTVKLQEVYGDD